MTKWIENEGSEREERKKWEEDKDRTSERDR
jgi:hypothetical protein